MVYVALQVLLCQYLDEDLFQKELKELDELYHELIDKIIKLTRIELFCRKNGISFLTNIKGEALLSDKLTFNYPFIFQIINNNSKMIQRPCRYQKDKFTQNIFLCCYGKFLSIISYRVLNIFIKRKNKYKSISYDAFIKLFMTNFKHNLILNGDVYYKDIVDKVNRL